MGREPFGAQPRRRSADGGGAKAFAVCAGGLSAVRAFADGGGRAERSAIRLNPHWHLFQRGDALAA